MILDYAKACLDIGVSTNIHKPRAPGHKPIGNILDTNALKQGRIFQLRLISFCLKSCRTGRPIWIYYK